VKVLLVGAGGREHALAWKLSQSPGLMQLFVTADTPGLAPLGTVLPVADDDITGITAAAKEKSVDLVVIGPEVPLSLGVADALAAEKIACFGPEKAAARLEASKGFMKDLCAETGIPTARYRRFDAPAEAKAFLHDLPPPYVIKADGLAAGKGVIIAGSKGEAETAIEAMFAGRFGTAGQSIVIEEFLTGTEASLFAICDGDRFVTLPAIEDHKRLGDGDTGPNTGGMGAFGPSPALTETLRTRAETDIIAPALAAMAARGTPFRGCLFAGLMLTADGPKLIEFNVRFGDPECQVLMRLLESDLLPVLHGAAIGALPTAPLQWADAHAALIVMATKGYPNAYEKGSLIRGVDAAEGIETVKVFHAGTRTDGPHLLANGGRVLNITALGATREEALARAYSGVDAIDWPEGIWRRDIGRKTNP